MRTTPIVMYKGLRKGNSWARWMVGRTMRRNQNNLVSIVGKTGSGKTWSGLSIAEIMAKMDGVPFNVDYVVFTLTGLMNLINSDKLKRGSKIVFDEPQVSISARDYQSEANKIFNYLLSTFRHRNLTLFFCTPFETLLDKNTRRLFHARFETMNINSNTKTCKLKPRYLEYTDFKPEPYRKQLLVFSKDKNGNKIVSKVFHWAVPKPSKELIKQYEIKKKDFTDNLNRNISARLEKYESGGKSITQRIPMAERKPLTQIQEKYMKAVANYGFKKATNMFDVTMSNVSQNVTAAKKKGYSLDEFTDVVPNLNTQKT